MDDFTHGRMVFVPGAGSITVSPEPAPSIIKKEAGGFWETI